MNGFSLFGSVGRHGKERKDAPIYPACPDRANDLDEKKWRQRPRRAVVVLLSNLVPLQYLPDSPLFVRGCVARGLGANKRRSFSREKKNCDTNIITIFQDPMTPKPRPGDNRRHDEYHTANVRQQ